MAYSNFIEGVEKGSGMFDINKKYFINNSTDEDIEVRWGAKEPTARGAGTYLIKSGEVGGPYEEFLAYHITRALVSREMQKDGKQKFFGSGEMRAPYEKRFMIPVEEYAPKEEHKSEETEEIKEQTVAQTIAKKRGRPRKEYEGANID